MNDYIGVLLLGGLGSRLAPASHFTNKHFLPVAGKPLFFYSLSCLVKLGARRIVVICNECDRQKLSEFFDRVFLGLCVELIVQDEPLGIADAIKITSLRFPNNNMLVCLGDNIFVSSAVRLDFVSSVGDSDAAVLLKEVNNPERFGVCSIGLDQRPFFVEKPTTRVSKLAVLGIYKFPSDIGDVVSNIGMSERGEYEVVDVLNSYSECGRCSAIQLSRADLWFDCGSYHDLRAADMTISALELEGARKIGVIEELCLNLGLISQNDLRRSLKNYRSCDYTDYLKSLC